MSGIRKIKFIVRNHNKMVLQDTNYARSLIEASLDSLITVNTEGKIMDINEAFAHATGLVRKKLIGSNFFDYFTEPEKAREVYLEVFEKGFVKNYPLTIKDHQLTDVLFNGSVFKDKAGKVLGVVVVARDVSVEKKIASELRHAKVFAELATRHAEEAKYVAEEAKVNAESAMRLAENAVKSKQQFLSNMSHEIRTPMNAIIGFTKVVLKTELSVKQKEYLLAIKLSGDALIVLINDILDLAKVNAGKMTFEQIPFKPYSSVAAMLQLFEPKTDEKNLVLIKHYDNRIPEVLLGDPVRLHQIILNLVSNAVKFTETGSITVSVILLNEYENTVKIEFSVTDTGVGIESDKMLNIFENFQQASSITTRMYGGTGLGLAIVKQLVESQGGTVSVTSEIDKGSTFSFILEFEKTNTEIESDKKIDTLTTDLKNIRVLVVEDVPLNQLLMRTLLDDYGFGCDIAVNGKIAIEKMETNVYDIILMDLQMPVMNGFEATHYIRNTLESKIPIIALTADVTTVDLAKCMSVGMNDYISKPVDERILYNKIVFTVKKSLYDIEQETIKNIKVPKLRCIDLEYLLRRTKSNPILMTEMIMLYLEQTPILVTAMKKSFLDKDWVLLYATVHKMIPSFSIVGIAKDFENMAKKIQEYAGIQQQTVGILEMMLQIENICVQACEELEQELITLKIKQHEKER